MQLHKSLRLFTAVIVTGSGTFAYLSFFHLLIDLRSKSSWVFLLSFGSVAWNYLAPIKQKSKTACYHVKNLKVMAGWGLEKIYYKKPRQTQPFLQQLTMCLLHLRKIQALSDFILLKAGAIYSALQRDLTSFQPPTVISHITGRKPLQICNRF